MRVPLSTYRLQIHQDFDFRAAARVVPYLSRLGISELYLSPIFQAAPGSTHGYDVLDHESLSSDLGGETGFRELATAAAAHGLGITVDFVPNHMGVGCDGNRYWEDVLKFGPAAEHATFFDIDWASPKSTLAGKLLLPILPDQYGVCLEAGELRLSWSDGAFRVLVSGRRLPVRPKSLPPVLQALADALPDEADRLRALAEQLQSIAEPPSAEETPAYREALGRIESRLASLLESVDESTRSAALALLNGRRGDAASFDLIDGVLRQQVYRLSSSQLALEAINYRRFFAVNELAAIRIELPRVFEAVHRRLFELVRAGDVTGIRLDHIDGLYDPIGYLRQLDSALRETLASPAGEAPLHVTVEKILAPDEQLPALFVSHGTTGYEFIRLLTGVFVDAGAATSLTALYRRFTSDSLDFADHLRAAKADVLDSLLASDITMLSHELERLAETDRRSRDLTWASLHQSLREILIAFSVYRSYVRPDGARTADDEVRINRAVVEAIGSYPRLGRAGYQFVRSLLFNQAELPGAAHFAMRFQQATGPVMAKSLEDTAFYRYARFVSENEVGGRPDRLGVSTAEFHAANALRAERYPLALISSSTHDTKRGEDVRARLSVLSEMPNTWRRVAFRLAERARGFRTADSAPSRIDEYLYYQTLIGFVPFGADRVDFPALEERLQAYLLKACREAKVNTSWLYPNEDYERGVSAFIHASLADEPFVEIVRRFCVRIERYGAAKALGQVALKLCAPGVPDTYQGSELWHQVLVDPDNRGPVDYDQRETALARIDAQPLDLALVKQLLGDFADGAVKLFVTARLLRLRHERPELFALGYVALEAGPRCIAFARGDNRAQLLCVVPRLPFHVTCGRAPWAMGTVWGDATVQAACLSGRYRNVLTGEVLELQGEVPLAGALAHFPIAVLVAE